MACARLLTPQPARASSGRDDVIHFPFSLLGRGLRCATVVTVHDLMWLEQPELVEGRPLMRRVRERYYRQGMRWALRFATRLIAVSEATRARMVATVPECAERDAGHSQRRRRRFRAARRRAARGASSSGHRGQPRPPTTWWSARTSRTKATRSRSRAFARSAREDELLVLIQRTSGGRGLRRAGRAAGHRARACASCPRCRATSSSTLAAGRARAAAAVDRRGLRHPGAGGDGLRLPGAWPAIRPRCVEVMGGAGLHAPVGDAQACAAP